jgi:hypothetical protein
MTKKLNIDIIAKDKTKRALTGVQNRLNSVKSSVFSLKGALIGIGAGAAVKSFVDVGREVESLGVRFKFLFGSAKEGSKAFDNLSEFAGKVPFSLEAISRASGNLAVVSKDADDLNRILEITGNVAAVTGLDFETAASQIQRSFAGGIASADIFREKGVRSLLGFKEGAKVSVDETVAAFEKAFSGDGKFANATKDLAQTLDGTISMIGDKYFNFQKDVAEGFFDELKKEFGDLNEFLEENEQQIKDIANSIGKNFAGAIQKTSSTIKSIAPAVKSIADGLGTTISGFQSLPTIVQEAGIISVLLFGKKGMVAFGTISFLMGQIEDLMAKAKEIPEGAFVNIDNLDEAQAKMDIVQKALKGLETSLSERGIDVFNIEDIDLDKLSKAETDRLNNIIQYRRQINELRIAFQNIHFENLGKQQSAFAKVVSHNFVEVKNEAKDAMSTNEELAKAMQKFAERNLAASSRIYQANKEIRDMETAEALAALDERERINNQKLENERRFLDELKKGRAREIVFEEMTQEKKKEILIGAGKDILGNLATFNKEAFRLNQALAIGDAIMSTAQGVAAGLKKGFPVGYIEAAITAAKGAAQIAAIRSAPPPRALGGSVTAGQPYIVGEQGREMFVPNQSGTIVSNDNLNKGTVVNVNIMANDTEGFDNLLVKRRSVIVNVINDALNSQGKEALI